MSLDAVFALGLDLLGVAILALGVVGGVIAGNGFFDGIS